MRAGCWKAFRRVVPTGANRRVEDAGNKDDDAHLRVHCAAEAAEIYDGVDVGFVEANALDNTATGELVVMRG